MNRGKNVLGTELQACSMDPLTGYFRDGHCCTGKGDMGVHTVCIQATTAFLEFSKAAGNDLSTPHPEWQFPGLKDGDRWCLCASRWQQAFEHGSAPDVFLEATHMATLEFVDLKDLQEHAVKNQKGG